MHNLQSNFEAQHSTARKCTYGFHFAHLATEDVQQPGYLLNFMISNHEPNTVQYHMSLKKEQDLQKNNLNRKVNKAVVSIESVKNPILHAI
jgi:hypothetical protein